jgi:ubiquinone/menaquinone biosynthesis C-methylase UbiE
VAEFHFVEDYQRLVNRLIAEHPIDEAMSMAVGGGYETIGQIEAAAVSHFGLREGMSLIDLGCGSGRLATAVSRITQIDYLGIDVVQELLDYAKTKSPAAYRFVLNRALHIPAPDDSADYVAAFSVFTHLLQPEIFLYIEDIKRVLRTGGSLIFSFLELAGGTHWDTFSRTVDGYRNSTANHLNTFIERNQINVWGSRLGYSDLRFVDGTSAPWGGKSLGQSIAVMKKA